MRGMQPPWQTWLQLSVLITGTLCLATIHKKEALAPEGCVCSLGRFPQGIAMSAALSSCIFTGWQQRYSQTYLDDIDEVVHCAVLLHEYVSIVDLVLLQWQVMHRPGHQQDLAVPLSPITQAAALEEVALLQWQCSNALATCKGPNCCTPARAGSWGIQCCSARNRQRVHPGWHQAWPAAGLGAAALPTTQDRQLHLQP